jgi:hypothetical protein
MDNFQTFNEKLYCFLYKMKEKDTLRESTSIDVNEVIVLIQNAHCFLAHRGTS